MKIATWNVNSVRARLERLLAWLRRSEPDIVCLQELKAQEEVFPHEAVREAGYHAAVYGQRTFNGVGILSRMEPQNVVRGMDDGVDDPQSRFLAAQVGEIQVLSAYIPNGQVVGSEQYAYKLGWLERVRAFLERHFTPETPLVLCGDFNVARDERDVADLAAWQETVLFHPTSRAALEELLGWGLVDLLRQQHPEGGLYSWWDYRNLAFPKNDGLRLDYIFATQPLACRCTAAEIDRQERKGGPCAGDRGVRGKSWEARMSRGGDGSSTPSVGGVPERGGKPGQPRRQRLPAIHHATTPPEARSRTAHPSPTSPLGDPTAGVLSVIVYRLMAEVGRGARGLGK